MTDTQFRIILDLYHEYHEVFRELPQHVIISFYERLYAR